MLLSLCSLLKDSPRRASRLLDPKFARICSACWLRLLWCGDGVGEGGGEGLRGLARFLGFPGLASLSPCSSSDSGLEPEYSTSLLESVLLSDMVNVSFIFS